MITRTPLVLGNLLLTVGVLLGFTFRFSAVVFVPLICLGALMRCCGPNVVPWVGTYWWRLGGCVLLFLAFWFGKIWGFVWLQVLALALLFGFDSFFDLACNRRGHDEPRRT